MGRVLFDRIVDGSTFVASASLTVSLTLPETETRPVRVRGLNVLTTHRAEKDIYTRHPRTRRTRI
jgi:hypothetical protein